MKTTRRQFLANLACAAVTLTAGWAMTGVRVEDAPAPLPGRVYGIALSLRPSGTWLHVKVDGTWRTYAPQPSPIILDERTHMVAENGRLVWRVPLDERTIAPELDGMPVNLEVSP